MKTRIFYVIHLDKKRISLLALFLFGLLGSFFFLGVSVGKEKSLTASANTKEELESPKSQVKESTEARKNEQVSLPESVSELSHSPTPENLANFANKAPETASAPRMEDANGKKEEAEETRLVSLPSYPAEDTEKVETLHRSSPPPKIAPQKSIPKKSSVTYSYQLAAFSRKADAEQFVKKIIRENPGLSAKQKPFIVQSGNYYTVRIGSFENEKDLKKFFENLRLQSSMKKQVILVRNT